MERSREELTRIHRAKCRELKKIRAKMAEDLGIELHQRECTYQGYCRGTCPACRKEELLLNAALLKRQLGEANLKGRAATAGLTAAAALCLAGCTPPDSTEGAAVSSGDTPFSGEQLEGNFVLPEEQTDGEILPPEEQTQGELLPPVEQIQGEFLPPEEYPGNLLPEMEESLSHSSLETPGEYLELEGDVAVDLTYLPETEDDENDMAETDETESTSGENSQNGE